MKDIKVYTQEDSDKLLSEYYKEYNTTEMFDYIDRLHNCIISKLDEPIYESMSKIVDGEEVSIDGSGTRNMIKALHDSDQSFVNYWKAMNEELLKVITDIKNDKL